MGNVAEIQEQLGPIASALRLDGYELRVSGAGDHLDLQIAALEDACEDCLSPPEVFARIVSGALKGAYKPEAIMIRYPGSTQ